MEVMQNQAIWTDGFFMGQNIYKDIARDAEVGFDESTYSKDDKRPLPTRKNKVIGMMKGKLGGKFMTGFIAQRAKMYACKKKDMKQEDKCCKGTKMIFDEYETCLFDSKTISRRQVLSENNCTQ